MRAEGELVQIGPAEAPLLGDHLGAGALVGRLGVAAAERLRVGMPTVGQRGAHRRARHRLHAAGDHHVVVPGDHTGSGEVHRLLTRPALPVHGHARYRLRPARGQHGRARDVECLLAGLHDTAPDDVVDERGVDTRALHQAVEHLGGQLARVHPRQTAVALADGRPDGLDDHGFSHELLLSTNQLVDGSFIASPGRPATPGSAFQWPTAPYEHSGEIATRAAENRESGQRHSPGGDLVVAPWDRCS